MKKLLPLLIILTIFCGCTDKPTSPYVISKAIKTKDGEKFDVMLYARLTKPEMVAIASKIKKDSSQYDNLQLDYLLPGNSYKNAGGVTVYAIVDYHEPKNVTPADTVMDLHDNRLRLEFVGFTPVEAKKLFAFKPEGMDGKTLSGKFIDDYTKTISFIYKDSGDKGQTYILELDTTGKVVSATQPMQVMIKGTQRLVISANGDYCTLQDGTLTLYSSDDPEKPYRTLKAGI